jgi:DUF1680 family protein
MSNKASIPVAGSVVDIQQQTEYPWNGKVNISVKPEKPQHFTLKIRIPGWTRNEVAPGGLYSYSNAPADQAYQVLLNGNAVSNTLKNGYVEISREWKANDQIELILPMTVRQVVTDEHVEENSGKAALEYGPLVYCAEEIDNKTGIDQITVKPQAIYTVERKPDLLGGINVISDGTSTFIPYYAWSNRGVGKMKVWWDFSTH